MPLFVWLVKSCFPTHHHKEIPSTRFLTFKRFSIQFLNKVTENLHYLRHPSWTANFQFLTTSLPQNFFSVFQTVTCNPFTPFTFDDSRSNPVISQTSFLKALAMSNIDSFSLNTTCICRNWCFFVSSGFLKWIFISMNIWASRNSTCMCTNT